VDPTSVDYLFLLDLDLSHEISITTERIELENCGADFALTTLHENKKLNYMNLQSTKINNDKIFLEPWSWALLLLSSWSL